MLETEGSFDMSDENLDLPIHNAINHDVSDEVLDKFVDKSNMKSKNIHGISADELLRGDTNSVTTHESTEINMPDIKKKELSHSLFNSDIVHNIIYTICMMQKYDNIIVPYQYFNKDKHMNDLIYLKGYNFSKTKQGEIMHDVLEMYNKYFHVISPHLIIWRNDGLFFYDRDLDIYISKILMNHPGKNYIVFKLTLIPYEKITHANMLVYIRSINTVVRFEPYGFMYKHNRDILNLDIFLKELFKSIIGRNITYLAPAEYMQNISPQTISNEEDNKQLGDPVGFCLAWSYWFLELLLNNNVTRVEDIQNILDLGIRNILNKQTEYNNNNPLIYYIREYANKLDDLKNAFMLQSGIAKENIYNVNYKLENFDKLTNYISEIFNQIIY